MRLVDADKLNYYCNFEGDCSGNISQCQECANYILDYRDIKDLPTAYDVDKVVEQIKMIAIPVLDEDEHVVPESNIHEACEIAMVALSNTIEIVKGGGICQ